MVDECLTVFKMAMRSHAKAMLPSSSLLNDPSKLDFTGRQMLIMLRPSPSTFLAVLALVRHLLHHHPLENLYNRVKKNQVLHVFSGSLAFNKYATSKVN